MFRAIEPGRCPDAPGAAVIEGGTVRLRSPGCGLPNPPPEPPQPPAPPLPEPGTIDLGGTGIARAFHPAGAGERIE
jgi:hypothetical protein